MTTTSPVWNDRSPWNDYSGTLQSLLDFFQSFEECDFRKKAMDVGGEDIAPVCWKWGCSLLNTAREREREVYDEAQCL